MSQTPNLFYGNIKSQNFGSGPNSRSGFLNPCKKNLHGEKLCIQTAGLLPDGVESPNLQIIGINGMWTTLCGLRFCESFEALKGLKVAAAVSRIEGCSTMVVCMPNVAP